MWLAILAGYTLVALLLLTPVLPMFGAAIPGGPVAAVDGWQNVWNLWWVRLALFTGRDPFVTDLLFFPEGTPLHLQTLGFINGVLVLPVTALWGPVAGYNAAMLLSLVLGGMAGYALALRVCGVPWAAFLAGLMFTIAPFHMTRIWDGQLELASLHWPALYALFLLRAVEDGRRRDAVLAGVFLACTGLSSWYYLLFMGLYALSFALLWASGPQATRLALRQTALSLLVGGLLLLPVLLPALRLALGSPGAVQQFEGEEALRRSANLLDFWLPSYLHPLWGAWLFKQVGRAWHDYSGDWNVALGYGALALSALAAARYPQRAWRWLALAGMALVFALGPRLQIGPWQTGLPLPYAVLEALPGINLGRRPLLFTAVATIALTPPVALGLRALGAMVEARRRWVAALSLALIAFELAIGPWPLLPADTHLLNRQLATGTGAVFEIPPAVYKYVEPQRAQLIHARPIPGGYLARPPRYAWPYTAPGVRPLWRMHPDPASPFLEGSDGPLAALAFYGVRDVVVRWDQIKPESIPGVRAALEQTLPGLAPVFDDGTRSLYHVPVNPGRAIAAFSGDGWQRPESDGQQTWRWMGPEGTLTLINPGAEVRRFTLLLVAQSYRAPRTVTLSLDGAPAGTWLVNRGPSRTYLHFWLAPGEHHLVLRAPADREELPHSSRLLSIVLLEARLESSAGAVPGGRVAEVWRCSGVEVWRCADGEPQ
ncbi:MAG: hypothetical protein RMK84_06655 [Oscillochloridaceae bacterium]|nr:hypothetical protein [Chloroflexaceae bacterium]MDW8389789.1 hypothetical protein [Oscillochloridaceae bacterium]